MQMNQDIFSQSGNRLLEQFYHMILHINIDEDSYQLVSEFTPGWADFYKNSELLRISEAFRAFACGELCHPEDRQRLVELTDLDYLHFLFTDNGFQPMRFTYRRKLKADDSLYRTVRMELLPQKNTQGQMTAFLYERETDDKVRTSVLHTHAFSNGDEKVEVKRKILVVEDDDLNRQLLVQLLSAQYDVCEAENGAKGYELLAANSKEISLVVLDVIMPVLDGYGFLKLISQNPTLAQIPVVVMTGKTGKEEEEKCLSLGAVDFIEKPYSGQVLLSRIQGIIRLRESSVMLSLMEYDELTGLYTRQAFYQHAEILLKRNPGKQYDLVVSDLEDFKLINERFGVHVGDEILKGIGRQLRKLAAAGVLVGRYNGDQFASLTEHMEGGNPLSLQEGLAGLMTDAPLQNIVMKFGIYENVDHDVPVSVLCDRAVMALRTIKHQYGQVYARFDEKLLHKVTQQQNIELDMHEALKEGQFKVYYQPKHDLKTGALVGAEALIRWIHPEYGFMPPGEFIPLFEKNGFVTETDYFVWARTCENLRRWIEQGLSVVPISVNASKLDFKQVNFLKRWMKPVNDNKVSHEYLHIEVTESLFSDDVNELIDILKDCREAGFQVELDDFGTGYSSLNTLGSLPLDVVKLEMSFVKQIHEERRMRVLAACINLAKSLKLTTVAEGVESTEQMEVLQNLGADVVQGYYFSRPIPEEEFENYLCRHTVGQKSRVDYSVEEKNDDIGLIIVDKEHKIISYNEFALQNYPGLREGASTEECFRQMEDFLPDLIEESLNQGIHIHWNAYRKLYELVDVMELKIPGKGMCYAISFSSMQDESSLQEKYHEREEKSQYMSMIKALTEEYNDVYSLNLKNGQIKVYRFGGYSVNAREKISAGYGYREAMETYVNTNVYEEDRESFRKATRLENVLDMLEQNGSFTHRYRVFRDGRPQHFMARFMKLKDEEYTDSLIVGFGDVDYETKVLLEEQKRQEMEVDFIKAITTLYYAAYYVSIEENHFEEMNGKAHLENLVSASGDAQESLNLWCSQFVSDEESIKMNAFNAMSTWQERLKDTNYESVRFHDLKMGAAMVNLIAARRDETGKVTHAIYAIRKMDE